jgi:hypothetical protein
MSHSQFHSKIFILRRAWLNLWDERMTTGRINQVTLRRRQHSKYRPSPNTVGSEDFPRTRLISTVLTVLILWIIFSPRAPSDRQRSLSTRLQFRAVNWQTKAYFSWLTAIRTKYLTGFFADNNPPKATPRYSPAITNYRESTVHHHQQTLRN